MDSPDQQQGSVAGGHVAPMPLWQSAIDAPVCCLDPGTGPLLARFSHSADGDGGLEQLPVDRHHNLAGGCSSPLQTRPRMTHHRSRPSPPRSCRQLRPDPQGKPQQPPRAAPQRKPVRPRSSSGLGAPARPWPGPGWLRRSALIAGRQQEMRCFVLIRWMLGPLAVTVPVQVGVTLRMCGRQSSRGSPQRRVFARDPRRLVARHGSRQELRLLSVSPM